MIANEPENRRYIRLEIPGVQKGQKDTELVSDFIRLWNMNRKESRVGLHI